MKPADVDAWVHALGGRKFLLVIGANAINTVLFACHTLSEAGYLTTFGSTVAAYLVTNHMQKRLEKVSG
jgi:hypothetical protein